MAWEKAKSHFDDRRESDAAIPLETRETGSFEPSKGAKKPADGAVLGFVSKPLIHQAIIGERAIIY
ncbi:hypothetical protein [Pararhizobium sp. DWP3-4]|uniref:hypothetical protein n=1 Tax=Pararhizobium sp. DWP3-4 TaxID=2804565 RepID=UPI003CEE37C5